MDINLSEFLKEFCPDIPESVRAGRIYKLTYSEDLKNFSFFAEYGSIVPYSDISALTQLLQRLWNLNPQALTHAIQRNFLNCHVCPI